jgi:enamine deaminase RidA (YjgF/YER057c/UK114 family)
LALSSPTAAATSLERTVVFAHRGPVNVVVEIWDDAGRHARSAIGAAELPFGIPVEVEAIVEVD